MRLILDTHIFLWWLADDPKLKAGAREKIVDTATTVFISAASVWEICIKAKLGRLDLAGADPVEEIAANGFLELPVSARHGAVAGGLPLHHADPFDRMLIAQARVEDLVIATRDSVFKQYDVRLLAL